MDLLLLLATIIGGYLLIFSGISIIKSQNAKSVFTFIATGSLSAILLVNNLDLPFNIQPIYLLIWPAVYLSLSNTRLRAVTSIYLLLPLFGIFLMQSVYSWFFDFIYLMTFSVFGLMIIRNIWNMASTLRKAERNTMLVGLLTIYFIRWLTPLFVLDQEMVLLIFHLCSGGFFIVLSAFSIQSVRPVSIPVSLESPNYDEWIKRKIEIALATHKLYKTPDLTVHELSLHLNMKSSELSAFMSNRMGKNFNDIVNEYRVNEVKRLMQSPTTDPKATLIELAYQSGFNSKATFNRIFKRHTGISPREFRNQVIKP
ncbi:MAG: helix-turn-helix transcriptional regulator [Cyclobacteriaceae bacterium]